MRVSCLVLLLIPWMTLKAGGPEGRRPTSGKGQAAGAVQVFRAAPAFKTGQAAGTGQVPRSVWLPSDASDSLPGIRAGIPERRAIVWVAGTQAAAYGASLLALNHAWYKEYPRSSLHFHNDMGDWLQMDKMGHVTTSYHLGRTSAGAFRLAGLDRKRSAWVGTASAYAFMTTIELLDGHSAQWGFSMGDQLANTLGAASFLVQELWYQEQPLLWKYSFRTTPLAGHRPDLLGNSLAERLIKDYNGMTFWLSVNLSSTLGSQALPPWLNLSVGYGAYGMLGGSSNPAMHHGQPLPYMERYRRWFLAPDVDLTRIATDSRLLKAVLSAVNFLKFPTPALEYNRITGWGIHLVFF
jgi:hypothetical protein